jgi:hypothetical protein
MLNDLGFAWTNELFEDQWEEMFQCLQRYAEENEGDCNIPGGGKENSANYELYLWLREQRKVNSILSKERRSKLDNLGLIWEESDKKKADRKWSNMYQRLIEYKQEHGDCRVPFDCKKGGKPWLGHWVRTQRQLYRKGLLLEDRQVQLEELHFIWKLRDGKQLFDDVTWNFRLEMLMAFKEEHGHCEVTEKYKKDVSFYSWVSTQRSLQAKGFLRQDRKQQLDEIGFTWNFEDVFFEQWREQYEQLKSLKEANGNLSAPDENVNLTQWVYLQRMQFANGRLDAQRAALLDEIGFRWEISQCSPQDESKSTRRNDESGI